MALAQQAEHVMTGTAPEEADSAMEDAGGHLLGNFPNYYFHNPTHLRVDAITPEAVSRMVAGPLAEQRPIRVLDIGMAVMLAACSWR